MDCRVTLAQIEATLGNLPENLDRHVETARAAAAAGSELVVFPELSLTGYFLKDQTSEVALRLDAPELRTLIEESKQVSMSVGFVERSRDGRLYNSVAFLEGGQIVHVHRKVHLVTYGMFEESRDFAAGHEFRCFDSRYGRFGYLTCEDLWHVPGGYLHFLNDVDAILVPSASPGRGVTGPEAELQSVDAWERLLTATAFLFRTWVVYVNRVGWEDGIVFGGGSRVADPFGELVAKLDLDAGTAEARLSSAVLERARVLTPLRRDEKPWILASGLADLEARKGLA